MSLFRRLCVADPVWNPAPAASCEAAAFTIPYAINGVALLTTALLAYRSHDRRVSLVAGVLLTVLAQPAAAEVHFILLGIPLLLLSIRPIELAVIAFLIIVPLDLTAERFTTGWSVVFAYPRLYAAWLLWAACARQLITTSLQPKAP